MSSGDAYALYVFAAIPVQVLLAFYLIGEHFDLSLELYRARRFMRWQYRKK